MMLKRTFATVAALTLSCMAAAAQQPQNVPPAKPAAAEQPPAIAQGGGQPLNVKVELTITDQSGPAETAKKTITMIVADRQNGSIRSAGSVRNQGRVGINVDARPYILNGNNLRLELALEYNPRMAGGGDNIGTESSLNERITVLLESGKGLMISQAADAASASDRRISVEVRATVMK